METISCKLSHALNVFLKDFKLKEFSNC